MSKKLDPMDLKQIIRLHIDKYSNRAISKTLGIGRNTINNYIQLFNSCDKDMHELLELDESDLTELFSTKTTINNNRYDRLMKYLESVKQARNDPGFTFLYHYLEYKSNVEDPYGYTQFMVQYNRKYTKLNGPMKLDLKPGNEIMIDFAGKHLHITNKETGELIAVEIFCSHTTL